MSRIDTVEKILEIKNRNMSKYSEEVLIKLRELENLITKISASDQEFVKYFPVAFISCLEGYFRQVIQELIDLGDPYLSNAEKCLLDKKFNFEVVKSFLGKKITIGEFIAHNISLGSLIHIDNVLSSILNKKFLKEMQLIKNSAEKNQNIEMLQDSDSIYADIEIAFKIRHIICHEPVTTYVINIDEVKRCCLSVRKFIQESVEFIKHAVSPNELLTQTDMNNKSAKILENAKNELEVLKKALSDKIPKKLIKKFNINNELWEKYIRGWSELQACQYEGGSIYQMIYEKYQKDMVSIRINEIKNYLDELSLSH